MIKTPNFKFNIGDTVTANVYGRIGTGKVLERIQNDITKLNQYRVEFVFSNNCVNPMWIYEDNLIKIEFKLKEIPEPKKEDIKKLQSILREKMGKSE